MFHYNEGNTHGLCKAPGEAAWPSSLSAEHFLLQTQSTRAEASRGAGPGEAHRYDLWVQSEAIVAVREMEHVRGGGG